MALCTAAHNLAAGAVPCPEEWPRVDGWAWVRSDTARAHIPRYTEPTGRTRHGRPSQRTGRQRDAPCQARDANGRLPTCTRRRHRDLGRRPLASFTDERALLEQKHLDRFGVVDLDDVDAPARSAPRFICVGYPPIGGPEPTETWAQDPPARLTGTLLGMLDGHYQASFASLKGFSGGPAFTPDGQFVGMLTGNDVMHIPAPRRDLSRIVQPEVLCRLRGAWNRA